MTYRFALIGALVLGSLAVSGCSPTVGAVPEPSGKVAVETTQTSVYFATGRSLVEEYRIVPTDKYLEGTLRELLRGLPEENEDVAVVQPEAEFRSVTIKNGVVTVDWDKKVLAFNAEPKEERLAFASFLYTFGQFPDIKKLRFTVEGKVDGKIDGKDVAEFWGDVSLSGQPWDVIRDPRKSKDASASADTSASGK